MHWLIGIAMLAGCDLVYGLERPPPGQFCLQPDVRDARFCADFDQDDGREPFAAFDLADNSTRYAVDEDAAHSQPLGARMTLVGAPGIDARLQRLLEVGGRFEASAWLNILRLNHPPIDAVKVMALHFGSVQAGAIYERVVYLTTEGNIVQKMDNRFPVIIQVDALPLERWVHFGLSLDLETAKGEVTVDDEVTPFDFEPIMAPMPTNSVRLTIGPHDVEPKNINLDVEMLYDDVVVR